MDKDKIQRQADIIKQLREQLISVEELREQIDCAPLGDGVDAVSYTHLTLPTILLV